MINDEEGLMRSILAYLKANLNTKLGLINTEKGDFTTETLTVDDDHFIVTGELVDLPNDIFCGITITDISLEGSIQDNQKLTVTFAVEVVFDNPKKANTYYKSLRYMRALYDTIIDYESSVEEIDELELTLALPMIAANNRRQMVISGVNFAVSLG